MSIKKAISLPNYVCECGEEIARQKFGGNFSALVCFLICSTISKEIIEEKVKIYNKEK